MVLNFESVINRVIFALQFGLNMTCHQGQGHALFILIDLVKPLLLKLQFLVKVEHKLLVDIPIGKVFLILHIYRFIVLSSCFGLQS